MRVQAAPADHYAWLVARVGCAITGDFRAIEAVDASDRIRGMVGFDLWTENACHLHFAAESSIALRRLFPAACDYVVNQAGKGLALASVVASNTRSRAAVEHLGFSEVARIRDGDAPGVDLILYELRKENIRALSPRKAA